MKKDNATHLASLVLAAMILCLAIAIFGCSSDYGTAPYCPKAKIDTLSSGYTVKTQYRPAGCPIQ